MKIGSNKFLNHQESCALGATNTGQIKNINLGKTGSAKATGWRRLKIIRTHQPYFIFRRKKD
jgi:hypothetical protein